MMKTTFDTVIFYVHNVELLTGFYGNNFGFSVQEQADSWVLLDPGYGIQYFKRNNQNQKWDYLTFQNEPYTHFSTTVTNGQLLDFVMDL